MTESNDLIMKQLSTVIEPELHRDIVSLGMVRDLSVEGSTLTFTLILTTPACPLKHVFVRNIDEAILGKVPGIDKVDIKWDSEVPADKRILGRMDVPMRSIIAVSSGKGGVGKSTVAVNVAIALAEAGAKVGLMDADILNPNLPTMTGVGFGQPEVVNEKMVPLEAYGVKVISTGFLIDPKRAMVMRGPMLQSAIRQFFVDVEWGEIDYMIVDLPPGTGDAPLSLAQSFPLTGVIIVTQPQGVAVQDALRSINMYEQLNVPVLGVVENMAGDFFGTGGGEKLAVEQKVPFLGRIPLDAEVRKGGDFGRPVTVHGADTEAGKAFLNLAQAVAARISVVMLDAAAEAIPMTVIG